MGAEEQDIQTEQGEEALTIGGKEVACKWVKSTVKVGGNDVVSKVWSSSAVPGGMVKMESITQRAIQTETRMIVTEFKTQ